MNNLKKELIGFPVACTIVFGIIGIGMYLILGRLDTLKLTLAIIACSWVFYYLALLTQLVGMLPGEEIEFNEES